MSFRGPDTRAGFTDFLYVSLIDAGIHAYRDDEELRVGKEIGPELLRAIKQSRISIPIFSKRYASSKWCLEELVQMVECNKTMGQKIMPIFYDVEPSEVRHQTGGYEQAFIEHESKEGYSGGSINQWKATLSEVGALKGWDLQSMPNRREGDLVKTVVKEVFSELKKGILALPDCLVEVDNHVSEIMRMIGPQTHETRIVGINGMGGLGKTTLAKIIYNRLSPDFEHCCFLPDIRETSRIQGIVYLQQQLISNILKRERKDVSICHIDEGIKMIKERLCGKRVLLFLDDVDTKGQLNALMGKRDWFGEGSKLIITSRNKEDLNVPQVDSTYELKCMDSEKSLHLFSKHAFQRDSPLDDYLTLSRKAVGIAGGLPLALEVIGSLLSCKSKENWDVILKKLEKVPHKEVSRKLKISFEALDDRQKLIFLDIACLFVGYEIDIVIYFWDEYKFFPKEALGVLQHMSLIKIDENNKLWMHDQIRDMGREIVCQESNMLIEKQSRVWDPEEGLKLLRTCQEKENVEALRLQFHHSEEHCFEDADLMRLPNLRLLKVDYGSCSPEHRRQNGIVPPLALTKSQHRFPFRMNFFQKKSHLLPKLQWLTMQNLPPDYDITKLSMTNLVVLSLAESDIAHHWNGWSHIKKAKNLKGLNLSACWFLVKTPNFSGLANLERLIMKNCRRLVSVDKSIGKLQRLVFLDVRFCRQLRDLPNEIHDLKSLKELLTEGTQIQDDMSSSPSYGQHL